MADKDKETCFEASQPTPDKPDDSHGDNTKSKKDDNTQQDAKTSQGERAASTESPTGKNSADAIVDMAEFLKEVLLPEIPGKVTVQFIKSNASKDVLIKTANEKARDKAHYAIINAFSENETVRVKRQKHLLWAVVILTSIQLLFFNGIIAGVAIGSFFNGQLQIINRLFDILKYYIGATVAELLGMVFFITKGTFSSSHIETMKMLFPQKKE